MKQTTPGYFALDHWQPTPVIVDRLVSDQQTNDMQTDVFENHVPLMHEQPVQMSDLDEMSIESFLYNENNNFTGHDAAAIPILQKKSFGCSSQERTRELFANVLVSTKRTSTMKAVFPEQSYSSIIIKSSSTYAVRKLGRIIALFVKKLLFGSACPIVSTMVSICQSTRE